MRERVAIVGAGVSGLGCLRFLRAHHDVTLFDPDTRPGGHAHTIDVTEPGTGRTLPMDTGFMVFNRVTYPHLTRLFSELAVPVKPTSMSFSVRHADSGLEYCGSSLNHLFAQRRNLLRPRFWRMLAAMLLLPCSTTPLTAKPHGKAGPRARQMPMRPWPGIRSRWCSKKIRHVRERHLKWR